MDCTLVLSYSLSVAQNIHLPPFSALIRRFLSTCLKPYVFSPLVSAPLSPPLANNSSRRSYIPLKELSEKPILFLQSTFSDFNYIFTSDYLISDCLSHQIIISLRAEAISIFAHHYIFRDWHRGWHIAVNSFWVN